MAADADEADSFRFTLVYAFEKILEALKMQYEGTVEVIVEKETDEVQ